MSGLRHEAEVEVELKTYEQGAGFILTLRELERARKSGDRYVLVGLMDDGWASLCLGGWAAPRSPGASPGIL